MGEAKKPRRKKAETVTDPQPFLSALAAWRKAPWATCTQLGFDETALKPTLKRLVADGLIVGVGQVKRKTAYALLGPQAPQNRLRSLAEQVLRERVQGDRLVLLPASSKAKAYDGLPAQVRGRIPAAFKDLVAERRAFPIKVGNSNLVALSVNLRHLAALADETSSAPQPAPPRDTSNGSIDPERVVRAYKHLSQERRSPHVIVADLQRQADVPLRPLQDWLLAECRAHRAIPLLGEPAHATEEQLAAALWVDGARHIYVQILEEGEGS